MSKNPKNHGIFVCTHCRNLVIRQLSYVRHHNIKNHFCNQTCKNAYWEIHKNRYVPVPPGERKGLKFTGTKVVSETKQMVGLALNHIRKNTPFTIAMLKDESLSSLVWGFYTEMLEREERNDVAGFVRALNRFLRHKYNIWKYEQLQLKEI